MMGDRWGIWILVGFGLCILAEIGLTGMAILGFELWSLLHATR